MKKYYTLLLLIYVSKATLCFGQYNMAVSEPGYLSSRTPRVPELVSPSNESVNLEDPVLITWKGQIHTSSYILQVSEEAGFSHLFLDDQSLSDSSYSMTGLEYNTGYFWRVAASNVAGTGDFSSVWSFHTRASTVGIRELSSGSGRNLLQPPKPNPFHLNTTIRYDLPCETKVTIIIYNSRGQLVKKLISGHQPAGKYKVAWDGRDDSGTTLPGGLFICVLSTSDGVHFQKILFQR